MKENDRNRETESAEMDKGASDGEEMGRREGGKVKKIMM